MDKIKESLTCKICNRILNEPVFLPCHKTLCRLHINSEYDSNTNKFIYKCFFCNEEHIIPDLGFETNEMAHNFIKSLSHLSDNEKQTKLSIETKLAESSSLLDEFARKEPELKLLNFEHFSNMRAEIDAKRDKLKLEIDALADRMINQTELYEYKCKEKLKDIKIDQSSINKDFLKKIETDLEEEFKKPVLEMELIENMSKDLSQKSNELQDKLNEFNDIKSRIKDCLFEANLENLSEADIGELSLIEETKLVSCSSDKTIKIWNLNRDGSARTIEAHSDSVFCIHFLSNKKLASGSFDKTIKIWDMESGECTQTLKDNSYIYCIRKLGEDEIITGGEDGSIKIWDLAIGICKTIIYGHSSLVTALEFLYDYNDIVISSSTDSSIKIWNLKSETCINVLSGHADFVFCIKLLNNGQLASGSNDCTIKLWDLKSGGCNSTLVGHEKCVNNLEVLSKNRIVSCSDDLSIRVWDLRSCSCVSALFGHQNIVICIRLVSSYKLISGSRDSTIKVWDLRSGKCVKTLDEHEKSVNCILLAPIG